MTMLFAFLFISFVVLSAFNVRAGKKGLVMESRLENFYQCPNKNTSMLFKDAYIKRVSSSESRLYGKIIFQEDIEDMMAHIQMYKCASKSEPDTCEYYTTLKSQPVCEFIMNKVEPWFTYFNGTTVLIQPPPVCFPKGNYRMTGVKIGLTKAFPLLDGYWRFKNKAIHPKGKLVGCWIMEMSIVSRFKV